MYQYLMTIDQEILLWIQKFARKEYLDPIFIFISRLTYGGGIWTILSVGLLFSKKTRPIGVMALIALGLTFIIDTMILKNLLERIRPYEAVKGLTSLVGEQKGYAFPSGYAGSTFAMAGILFGCMQKKHGILIMILAALISVTSLYVGIHYPSDVICGALIGILTSIVVFTMWTDRGETI